MTRTEATQALAVNPNPHARAIYKTRDATGDHWISVRCWLDDDELVQSHPTDPRHYPIAAPDDVAYSIEEPSADEIAWREEQTASELADHPSILSAASGPAKILAHLRAHGWRQSGGPGQTPMWSLHGPSMDFTVVDPRGLQGSELAKAIENINLGDACVRKARAEHPDWIEPPHNPDPRWLWP